MLFKVFGTLSDAVLSRPSLNKKIDVTGLLYFLVLINLKASVIPRLMSVPPRDLMSEIYYFNLSLLLLSIVFIGLKVTSELNNIIPSLSFSLS